MESGRNGTLLRELVTVRTEISRGVTELEGKACIGGGKKKTWITAVNKENNKASSTSGSETLKECLVESERSLPY